MRHSACSPIASKVISLPLHFPSQTLAVLATLSSPFLFISHSLTHQAGNILSLLLFHQSIMSPWFRAKIRPMSWPGDEPFHDYGKELLNASLIPPLDATPFVMISSSLPEPVCRVPGRAKRGIPPRNAPHLITHLA